MFNVCWKRQAAKKNLIFKFEIQSIKDIDDKIIPKIQPTFDSCWKVQSSKEKLIFNVACSLILFNFISSFTVIWKIRFSKEKSIIIKLISPFTVIWKIQSSKEKLNIDSTLTWNFNVILIFNGFRFFLNLSLLLRFPNMLGSSINVTFILLESSLGSLMSPLFKY